MERDSFIFYKSFYEATKDLPDNIKLEVLTAIAEYALYGKEPENLKPYARCVFVLVKPLLSANISRYENGKKGGRKPKKKDMYPIPEIPVLESQKSLEFASFEEEVAQIKTDQLWREPVCMQFHISKEELEQRLDAFVTHCKVERDNELHPSLKDAKRHFISWMRKVYPPQNSRISAEAKPDDYSFKGGFGGLDT